MYSNGGIYIPDRKPPMGAFKNPYLKINRGIVLDTMMWEGAGPTVEDLSGNNITGTFGVGALSPTWVPGKFGPAIDFEQSNDQYISLTNYGPLSILSKGTVVIWFNIETLLDHDTSINLLGCGNTTSLCAMQIRRHNDIGGVETRLSITHVNGNVDGIMGNTALVAGVDYCAAFVSDGSSYKMYLNGVDEGAVNVWLGNDDGEWFAEAVGHDFFGVGAAKYDGSIEGWDGLIHCVIAYSRILSTSEIVQLSQEPFCGFRWASIEQLAVYYEAVAVGGIVSPHCRIILPHSPF